MKDAGGWRLRAGLAALLVLALLGCSSLAPAGAGRDPSPATPVPTITVSSPSGTTPGCRSAGPTPAQAEGPFFKPGAPQRQSLLEPGMPGVRLVIQGQVLSRGCQPVAGVRLDFWQADAQGEYDAAGYRLRGHQFTDAAGGYRLETVVPAEYPGRPPHIHVKVAIPNGPALTTQLYFPGEGGNASDSLFNPQLVLDLKGGSNGKSARFDFVP